MEYEIQRHDCKSSNCCLHLGLQKPSRVSSVRWLLAMDADCVMELISVGSAVAKLKSRRKEWRVLEKCIVDYYIFNSLLLTEKNCVSRGRGSGIGEGV